MNKHLAVFALVTFTLASVASYSAPQVLADWLIDRSGTLIKLDPMVLGDDDVDEVEIEDSQETEPIETSNPESSSGNNEVKEQQRERLKQQAELKRETAKTQKEISRETAKKALERKIELNKRLNKDINNEFEISASSGELKIKQKTKLPSGQEKEVELEMEENESLHVDQEDGDSVEIEAKQPGVLEITKDKFKGQTRLPISVNENNELIVTRPDGTTKTVSVLPDVAIAKMIEKGILISSDSSVEPLVENVELTTSNTGEPVYVVKKELSKKFLGLVAMKFQSETEVSATDSDSVITSSSETKPWRRFLESLSR